MMITKSDVARCWVRRIFQYVFAGITCLFLVLSLARIFDVNVVSWPSIAKFIVSSYGDILVWMGQKIIDILSAVPVVIFDLLTAYLLIGALMRLSIIDIGLRSEKDFFDLGPRHWGDSFVIEGIKETREGTKSESNRFRLLWYIRLISDLKAKYYTLTPVRIFIYLLIVFVLFALGIFSYGN